MEDMAMALRTTDNDVRDLFPDRAEDVTGELTAFITPASLIVDEIEATADTRLNDDLLKEIERWLAAHFLSILQQPKSQEKIGDAQAVYQGTTGMGLEFTFYGQQARMLDPTGHLAARDKKKTPLVFMAMGTSWDGDDDEDED